uniref:DUF547 domain-containing protein n=1 Tax=Oryza brachyantha TaxID=4533 RepID=J3N4V0_ORYBR
MAQPAMESAGEAGRMEQGGGGAVAAAVVARTQEPCVHDGGKSPRKHAAGLQAAAALSLSLSLSLASSDRSLEPCKHAALHDQRCAQTAQATPNSHHQPDAATRKSHAAEQGSGHHGLTRDHSRASASPNHRVSLENDIRQLQLNLHQERSIRIMLDRAIGRASSTLSPGHMHFPAQTKELIAEIELLEEEIANREQHVLTLYRSIFDQSVSGPSSGQSSGLSSPAHTKSISSRTRRHPSIISSAFCSSKKLPLQPFQIMTSVSEAGKSKSMLKTKIKHESFSSETLDVHPATFPPDPRKLPYSGSSSLTRTLKDHLYQCPSKISEEMVRCMASIYCLLRTESPENSEKIRSPFLSRSSTNVILPRRGNGEDTNLSNTKCTVEVSSISADKNHMPDVSYAITHYRLLVEQLERVDLSMSDTNIKLAFWINVYNSLVMHAAYNIGGHAVTANSIEHALLCCRSPRIGRWFESILSTAMRKKCADEKQLVQLKFGLPDCQPLALFALCTGASSDPMLKVYTAKNIAEELERAKREFLQASVVVRKSKKVFLPRLVERYAREAGLAGADELLTWARDNADASPATQDAIQRIVSVGNEQWIRSISVFETDEWITANENSWRAKHEQRVLTARNTWGISTDR